MHRILVLAAFAAFTLIGCSQAQDNSQGSGPTQASQDSQPEGYGNNPRLDNLYDDCAAGDATACENLYIESPLNSDYEAFAIEQGGAEGLGSPPETTMQEPEPEQVPVGESFELNGFEWTVIDAEVVEDRPSDSPTIAGPYVVLGVEVTNVSDDYQAPTDNAEIKVYTDQTSYYIDNFEVPVAEEEDITSGEMAPDTSRTGVLVGALDGNETLVEAEWLDAREELFDYQSAFIVNLEDT